MKRKTNPRRVPASKADVEKAKKKATNDASKVVCAIFFMALRDKEGWGMVRLKRLWEEVNYISDSISRGYINANDILTELEEYGIVFKEW